MGNANGREEGIEDDRFPVVGGRSNGESGSESMGIAIGNNTPPHSPARSPSPILFAPQVLLFFFIPRSNFPFFLGTIQHHHLLL